MKQVIRVIFLIVLICIFYKTDKVNAITLPNMIITSNKYSVGSEITRKEKSKIMIGESLQLYAIMQVGNDVPPNTGNFVYEELNDVIWKSENDQIVEVNNTGEIKGITSGKVKIYAIDGNYTAKGGRYTAEDGRHIAEKEIEVVAKSNNIFDLEHIIPITILIIIFMTFLNKKLKKKNNVHL